MGISEILPVIEKVSGQKLYPWQVAIVQQMLENPDRVFERLRPHVLHLQASVPGWDTKILCDCGDRFASRAEFWKHQADAYVSLVRPLRGSRPLSVVLDEVPNE